MNKLPFELKLKIYTNVLEKYGLLNLNDLAYTNKDNKLVFDMMKSQIKEIKNKTLLVSDKKTAKRGDYVNLDNYKKIKIYKEGNEYYNITHIFDGEKFHKLDFHDDLPSTFLTFSEFRPERFGNVVQWIHTEHINIKKTMVFDYVKNEEYDSDDEEYDSDDEEYDSDDENFGDGSTLYKPYINIILFNKKEYILISKKKLIKYGGLMTITEFTNADFEYQMREFLDIPQLKILYKTTDFVEIEDLEQ